MNRIITRGMGSKPLLITRGYGTSILSRRLREVLRLFSRISTELSLVSEWKKTQ